jgi:hypothetical protein
MKAPALLSNGQILAMRVSFVMSKVTHHIRPGNFLRLDLWLGSSLGRGKNGKNATVFIIALCLKIVNYKKLRLSGFPDSLSV